VGFTSAQADENLEAPVLEVALEGNKGAGAAFFDLTEESVNFGLMKKEFTGAVGFGVGAVTVAVGGDVKGVEPGLPVFDSAVRVCEVAPARADGFDLRPSEDHPGLNGF
jgi:hypothetical protein